MNDLENKNLEAIVKDLDNLITKENSFDDYFIDDSTAINSLSDRTLKLSLILIAISLIIDIVLFIILKISSNKVFQAGKLNPELFHSFYTSTTNILFVIFCISIIVLFVKTFYLSDMDYLLRSVIFPIFVIMFYLTVRQGFLDFSLENIITFIVIFLLSISMLYFSYKIIAIDNDIFDYIYLILLIVINVSIFITIIFYRRSESPYIELSSFNLLFLLEFIILLLVSLQSEKLSTIFIFSLIVNVLAFSAYIGSQNIQAPSLIINLEYSFLFSSIYNAGTFYSKAIYTIFFIIIKTAIYIFAIKKINSISSDIIEEHS